MNYCIYRSRYIGAWEPHTCFIKKPLDLPLWCTETTNLYKQGVFSAGDAFKVGFTVSGWRAAWGCRVSNWFRVSWESLLITIKTCRKHQQLRNYKTQGYHLPNKYKFPSQCDPSHKPMNNMFAAEDDTSTHNRSKRVSGFIHFLALILQSLLYNN